MGCIIGLAPPGEPDEQPDDRRDLRDDAAVLSSDSLPSSSLPPESAADRTRLDEAFRSLGHADE